MFFTKRKAVLFFIVCLIFFFLTYNDVKSTEISSVTGYAKVTDGDTLKIDTFKIRLHGIDAPETTQTCKIDLQDWYCGKQSTAELKKIIDNQSVECKVSDIDIYDRYVAICSTIKTNLNKWMVKNGWAIAYRYYSKDYIEDEIFAKKNRLGMWKGSFTKPSYWRRKN